MSKLLQELLEKAKQATFISYGTETLRVDAVEVSEGCVYCHVDGDGAQRKLCEEELQASTFFKLTKF